MKFLLTGAILALLASCTQYTHVYRTEPSASTNNQESSFDNDTVRVEYNFWAENGRLSFSVYNKLTIPIYIDWRKCSFVQNTIKLNYWEDVIQTKSSMKTSPAFIMGELNTQGQSLSSRQEQISFVPPRSVIERTQYILRPGIDLMFKGGNRSEQGKFTERRFSEKGTPLGFRNFMTLSTTADFKQEFYIDNGYYVSAILEMKTKDFIGQNQKTPGLKTQRSTFQTPSSFYVLAANK